MIRHVFIGLIIVSSYFGICGQEIAILAPEKTSLVSDVTATLENGFGEDVIVSDTEMVSDIFRSLPIESPFNQTSAQAKRLGTAIGADFLVVIRADTLRRSTFEKPLYYESFAAFFLVETRSGDLIDWSFDHLEKADKAESGAELIKQIERVPERLLRLIKKRYRARREPELVADDNFPANSRFPLPYVRKRPPYTKLAKDYQIEATIDVLVKIDADGSVKKMRFVRWAGYGLEESVTKTIREMDWRPADKEGKAFTSTVLLRYNFKDLRNKELSN